MEEQFQLSNTSVNAVHYEWSFCEVDFSGVLAHNSAIGSLGATTNSLRIIKVGDEYIGFAVGTNNNLIRLEFGKSIDNSPSIHNLGDLGVLKSPQGIDIVKEGDKWVGFIGHQLLSNGFVSRVIWDDIKGTPTAESIGNLGVTGRNREVLIVEQDNAFVPVFLHNDGRQLIMVDFKGSLLNNIEAAVVHTTGGLVNVSAPIGFDLTRIGDEWRAVLSSSGTKNISIFDFGTDIFSVPTLVKEQSFPELGTFLKSALFQQQDIFYLYVSVLNKDAEIIKLNTLNPETPIERLTVSESLPYNVYGVEVINELNNYFLFSTASSIFKTSFIADCPASIAFSEDYEPDISYSEPGTYPITLKAFHEDGSIHSTIKEINVSSNVAPTGEILVDSAYCIKSSIQFEFLTNDNISNPVWGFGDGNSSTDRAPVHQYSEAGEYNITLQITSDAGCTNFYKRSIWIFNEPQTSFSTEKSAFCTAETINFLNESPNNEYADYLWDFNGEGNSTEKNPSFTFESVGTKIIYLTTDALGCNKTSTLSIEIIEGPVASFSYNKDCLEEPIQFSNQSTGNTIISYRWDFGNGESSIETDPIYQFDQEGEHRVSLTASNTSGCEASYFNTISVFEEVVDSIYISKAIENISFSPQLDWLNNFDSTQNISYQWEISGDFQNSQIPSFNLPEGEYVLNLEIITEKGCVFQKSRTIEVSPSEYAVADFHLTDKVCIGEQFSLENASINTIRNAWSFCEVNFAEDPIFNNELGNMGISTSSLKIIKVNGEYLGFATGTNNSLLRLDFGESIDNIPEITNLGNLDILQSPQGIDIVQEGDKWIGFIGHQLTTNGKITRLIWNDIKAVPIAESIGNLGVNGRNREVVIIDQNGEYVPVFLHNDGRELIRIDFKGSLLNDIKLADIQKTGSLTNVNAPIGFDIVKIDNNWKAVITSPFTKNISIFEFGADIFSVPTLVKEQSFPEFSTLLKTSLFEQLGTYFLFVSIQNQGAEIIQLNTLDSNTSIEKLVTAVQLPDNVYGVDVIKEKNNYYLFSSSNSFFKTSYIADCPASITYSEELEPNISYSSYGSFPITLTSFHKNGTSRSITKEITVTEDIAPQIDIYFTDVCQESAVDFDGISMDMINTWQWEFSDSSKLSGRTIHHQFAEAGKYNVRLDVNDGTCSNFVTDSITIYEDAPTPVFDFEAISNCTNTDIKFINLTNTSNIPDSLITYSWNFNNEIYSSASDTTILFTSAGDKNLSLTASIPGCTNETAQQVIINEGALVDFSFEDQCEESEVQFINNTVGNITELLWTFGNSDSSATDNPVTVYEKYGEYLVNLEVMNDKGCITSKQDTITIHDVPKAAFSHALSCEGLTTSFFDESTVEMANINDWNWTINDETFTEASPGYIFDKNGNYNTTLKVSTEYGCSDTIEKVVEVRPSPVADFSFLKACINEPVEFADESSFAFGSIKNWQWVIDGKTYTGRNISNQYNAAGAHNVTLTVTADNLCKNTKKDTVTIFDAPQFTFSNTLACEQQPVEVSTLIYSQDPVITRNWYIDNQWYSDEEEISFVPDVIKPHEVRLDIITEQNCLFSSSKPITVNPTPVADFEASTTYGGAPLEVTFNDYSSGGKNISWYRNDMPLLVQNNVPNMLMEIDDHVVKQVVTTEIGCSDSAYIEINVVEAKLDLELKKVRVVSDGGNMSFVLDILNKGTAQVKDLEVTFSINNEVNFRENIYSFLNSGDDLTKMLSSTLESRPRFICFTLNDKGTGLIDTDPDNNRLCVNFETSDFLLKPYPNPATDIITIPLLLQKDGEVMMQLINARGAVIYKASVNGKQNELTNYQLRVGTFPAGLYIMKVISGDYEQSFPVIINH